MGEGDRSTSKHAPGAAAPPRTQQHACRWQAHRGAAAASARCEARTRATCSTRTRVEGGRRAQARPPRGPCGPQGAMEAHTRGERVEARMRMRAPRAREGCVRRERVGTLCQRDATVAIAPRDKEDGKLIGDLNLPRLEEALDDERAAPWRGRQGNDRLRWLEEHLDCEPIGNVTDECASHRKGPCSWRHRPRGSLPQPQQEAEIEARTYPDPRGARVACRRTPHDQTHEGAPPKRTRHAHATRGTQEEMCAQVAARAGHGGSTWR